MLKQTPEVVKQSIPSIFLKIIKAREVNQELEGKFLKYLSCTFLLQCSQLLQTYEVKICLIAVNLFHKKDFKWLKTKTDRSFLWRFLSTTLIIFYDAILKSKLNEVDNDLETYFIVDHRPPVRREEESLDTEVKIQR